MSRMRARRCFRHRWRPISTLGRNAIHRPSSLLARASTPLAHCRPCKASGTHHTTRSCSAPAMLFKPRLPSPWLWDSLLLPRKIPILIERPEVLEIKGVRVETYGTPSTRPPLLLVHGGCQGSWAWQKIGPRLASDGWFVLCLNWFGHHGSAPLPPAEALARSILDVTTEVGVVADFYGRIPVLVGHSMGGLACLAFASARPVAALVLLAPVVPAEFAVEPIDLPVDSNIMWFPPSQLVDRAWWGEVSADEASYYRSLLCLESPRAVLEATRWLCHVDTSDLVHIPTLIFCGDVDLLVPPDAVRTLAHSLAADFVLLQATGHGIPLNPVWVDVAAKILRWLPQRLDPGAGRAYA
jgi:pimeloyl-ACP methyl ester carboxylesterase